MSTASRGRSLSFLLGPTLEGNLIEEVVGSNPTTSTNGLAPIATSILVVFPVACLLTIPEPFTNGARWTESWACV